MKLTENQRRILYAVTLNAGRSVAELAKMLELRDHVIRRALDSFFEANIFLRRSTWVNTHLLGLDYHVIHIELPLASISARKSFLELLASSEEAAAVVELSSEAQFELRIVTRNSLHLSQFFESISERFKHPFRVLRCWTTLELEYSGPNEPSSGGFSWKPLRLGPPPAPPFIVSVDATDHAILSALANEDYLNLRQLSRIIGIPAATLQYRVSRLEANSVISGHFYVMDPKIFHYMPVGIQVRSRALTSQEKKRLKSFAHQHPRISWIGFFLGDQSAEIYTLVQDFNQAQAVVADLSAFFKETIDSVHMTQQISFSKYSTYPYKSYETLVGSTPAQKL